MLSICTHMVLSHLGHHIQRFGPLRENWTLFIERYLRVLKGKTNPNGRDVTRVALAENRMSSIRETERLRNPVEYEVPSYHPSHVNGIENADWRQKRMSATELRAVIEMIVGSIDEISEADIRDQKDSTLFCHKLEYKGRRYNSRYAEQSGQSKRCNSIAYFNWGEHADIKHATLGAIKGFYQMQVKEKTFCFVSLRTIKEYEHKSSYPYAKRVDLEASPTGKAATGEIVDITQLNTSCVPVLLPILTVIPMPRGRYDISRNDRMYWVCPVYS